MGNIAYIFEKKEAEEKKLFEDVGVDVDEKAEEVTIRMQPETVYISISPCNDGSLTSAVLSLSGNDFEGEQHQLAMALSDLASNYTEELIEYGQNLNE